LQLQPYHYEPNPDHPVYTMKHAIYTWANGATNCGTISDIKWFNGEVDLLCLTTSSGFIMVRTEQGLSTLRYLTAEEYAIELALEVLGNAAA
jgi:acyl-CoA hydrolase